MKISFWLLAISLFYFTIGGVVLMSISYRSKIAKFFLADDHPDLLSLIQTSIFHRAATKFVRRMNWLYE